MKNKRGILYWLRVIALIGCIGLMIQRCTSRASADTVELSYEQSLALFGTTIEGTYYSNSLNQDIPCYAVYSGRSSDYVPSDHFGSYFDYSRSGWSWNGTNSGTAPFPIPDMDEKKYLIYRICSTSYGTNWPSWSSSYYTGHHNFSCTFPFDVGAVTDLQFSVLYSFGSVVGSYPSIDDSSLNLLTSQSSVNVFRPLGWQNYPTRVWTTLTSLYKQQWYGEVIQGSEPLTAQNIPESYRVNMSYLPCKLNYNDVIFSISGFNLGLNNVGAYQKQEYDGFAGVNGSYCPLLFVQCPVLTGYTIPETTPPTTAATTRPYQTAVTGAPAQTVDLSNLESGVAAIVQQEQYNGDTLDWIGNNTRITANNLWYVCEMLDKIYARMAANGEVAWSPELQSGQNPAFYGTDLQAELDAIIAGHTTATLPALSGNNRFVRSAFAFLWDIPFVAAFGALSLGLSVASWIIFRGRGG